MSAPSAPEREGSFRRFLAPLGLVAAMWIVQFVDAVLPLSFTGFGIRSWDLGGLIGIVIGPLLHGSWSHLVANTGPLLVLGCLVAVEGARTFWRVTAIAALIGGAGTWVFNAPGTLTVGASVLVFGYFGYVVLRVFSPRRLSHRVLYAGIALVVIALYGGAMFTGVFGAASGVSWQAHLFGAIGGGMAALGGRGKGPAE